MRLQFSFAIRPDIDPEQLAASVAAVLDTLAARGVAFNESAAPVAVAMPASAPAIAPVRVPSADAKGPKEIDYNARFGGLRLTAVQSPMAATFPAEVSAIREAIAEHCLAVNVKNGLASPAVFKNDAGEWVAQSTTGESTPAESPPVTTEGNADAGADSW